MRLGRFGAAGRAAHDSRDGRRRETTGARDVPALPFADGAGARLDELFDDLGPGDLSEQVGEDHACLFEVDIVEARKSTEEVLQISDEEICAALIFRPAVGKHVLLAPRIGQVDEAPEVPALLENVEHILGLVNHLVEQPGRAVIGPITDQFHQGDRGRLPTVLTAVVAEIAEPLD